MREWWTVAVVFSILGALFLFVFLVAREPAPDDGAAAPAAEPDAKQAADPAEVLERFYRVIEERQPRYDLVRIDCPVCGTQLDVPEQASSKSNNRFGGVATDIMSIALSPPPPDDGRPSLEQQDWEMLQAPCPTCGAVYQYLDLYHLRAGHYAITDWDLAALAPPLAARDPGDWTVDERAYARVLTMRAAGVEEVELGFAALQGAYAANFGTWYGKPVHIPAAAFYALAAAYFAITLETDEQMNAEARAVTAMTMGECLRLLGRAGDARAAFALVHELENTAFDLELVQHRAALDALAQLEELLAAGDFSLHRARIPEFSEPPVGWYLDEMLPAMNAHIAEHREAWTALDDPAEIHSKLLELLP